MRNFQERADDELRRTPSTRSSSHNSHSTHSSQSRTICETHSKGGTSVSSLIKRLLMEVFKHHSNPWSAWTRLISVPLVFVPIWTRSWREGAIVVVWLGSVCKSQPDLDRC